MKVKLDEYYLGVLINGLFSVWKDKGNEEVNNIILRLIDEKEELKPKRKARLVFQPREVQLIQRSLIEWRNAMIQAEKEIAVEVISELIEKLI